ncbi:helicase DnaB [Methylobacterium nodulans]|uniref:DnaB domain protein helicase domain protein n=1 Tax=Methylobacterium nodulans (strain LMG 21967 / CNCM I-2342 / ORS 2060) TaxID=460265 RepID=B8IMP6_METNO|nr:helicase DnaB [Methylobacterium nodulans]ACL60239.1 DnaB domain protein helicase domain protein [Methylobacterium nodulans ORS 2060]
MSQGLQLLSAVLAANSRAAMRMLDPGLFTPEELPARNFIVNHYRAYGQRPTPEVCRENGHRLVPATEPVDYYLTRVKNRAIGRAWQAAHPSFAQAMAQANVEQGVQVLTQMVREANRFNTTSAVISLADAAQMVREDYDVARDLDGLRGITFGWEPLDQITLGQADGDVTVFVARPGIGKSWTMLYCALAAWRAGHSVLFVSMEMTVLQTARRYIAMLSGLNPKSIREGRMSTWAQDLLYDTINSTENGAPFHFLAGDLERSVADVDNLAMEFTPDIIFVDAAYLLDPENRGGKFAKYAKHETLQDVFKGLKQLATRRNVPVTVSVQFNRTKDEQGKKGLDQIGGSDWIGQIASNVLSIDLGEEPNQRTTRRYKLHKARDADDGFEFETNFAFSPFDMEFRREIIDDETAATAEMVDLQEHML